MVARQLSNAQGLRQAMEYGKANSQDPDTQVGCLIMTSEYVDYGSYPSYGANRMPGRINPLPERLVRPEKYLWLQHAEVDAIGSAGGEAQCSGGKMYLPWFPCAPCARAIVQANIHELVCFRPETDSKWADDFRVATEMLQEGGVIITYEEKFDVKG